jgi:hypothetical protein
MIYVDIYDLLWYDVVTRIAVVYQNRFLPRRLHLKHNKPSLFMLMENTLMLKIAFPSQNSDKCLPEICVHEWGT